MPKRTTIEGMRLKCGGCNAVFIIGSAGVDATRQRVMEHMLTGCHSPFCFPVDTPFSRPEGLTYIGDDGDTVVVYDGKNWDKFWNEVKTASLTFRTVMSPQMELTEKVLWKLKED